MISQEELKNICASVEALSLAIGTYISGQRVDTDQIESKSFNNLVSHVDKEAENRFVAGLKHIFPEAGFIGEEGHLDRGKSGWDWIIDPLDGTTNFLHGLPFWCTSVALVYKNEPILGVIYSPVTAELFSAWKNGGCFLNGSPCKVSGVNQLKNSLIATGFPYDDFGKQEAYMRLLKELMPQSRGIRRIGSAALDLAYVACGRFETFYEYGLNSWDVAAGIIQVREAGGIVTDFQNTPDALFSEELCASNGSIHQDILEMIRIHFLR